MKRLLLLKTRAILGGCIGLVFAMLAWSGGTGPAAGSDLDYRLRLRKPLPVSDNVRLVGIEHTDVGAAAATMSRFCARCMGCAAHSRRTRRSRCARSFGGVKSR